MRLLSKKAYLGLALTLAVTVIGFLAGGLELAVYAALSGGLSCAVGLLWIETNRLRRAQATRTNRIAKRLTLLEQQTSHATELFLSQQDELFKRLDAMGGDQAEGLKASVREILATLAGDAAQRAREFDELREATRKLSTTQAEQVSGAVAEAAKRSESELHRVSREENRVLYKKVDGLMALYRDIEPDRALPPLHSWAAAPDFARVIYREVIDNGRTRVFECGSGSSTIILAYALRSLGAGRVVALEHDAEFARATRLMLAERGLSEWAEIVHAPLADVDIDGTTWRWYDPAAIPEGAIDLLLVDGPPGPTGPMARYPAMPVLAKQLAPGAVIMLDDANREEERAIGKRWRVEFDGYSAKVLKTDCGTLVLRPIATAGGA